MSTVSVLLPVFKKEVLFPFSQRGIFVKSLVQGFFADGFKKNSPAMPGQTFLSSPAKEHAYVPKSTPGKIRPDEMRHEV